MEDQLAAYRAKKAKEKQAEQSIFKRFFTSTPKKSDKPTSDRENVKAPREAPQTQNTSEQVPLVQTVQQVEQLYSDWKQYIPLALSVLLWFLLWKFFIEIGFGAVYFIISCSYLMYRNTRTGPRERNSLSAYSVFNPNQERLDGTFTTEQFERELRFGAGTVK